jgi:hypothetical protein
MNAEIEVHDLIIVVSDLIAEGNIHPDHADSSDDRDWLSLDWNDLHLEFGIDAGKASGLAVNILQDRTADDILSFDFISDLIKIDRLSSGIFTSLLAAGKSSLGKKLAAGIQKQQKIEDQAQGQRKKLDQEADQLIEEKTAVYLPRRVWAELVTGTMGDDLTFEESLNIYLGELARHDIHVINISHQVSVSPNTHRLVHNSLVTYFSDRQITWDQAITRYNDMLDDANAAIGFIVAEDHDAT